MQTTVVNAPFGVCSWRPFSCGSQGSKGASRGTHCLAQRTAGMGRPIRPPPTQRHKGHCRAPIKDLSNDFTSHSPTVLLRL